MANSQEIAQIEAIDKALTGLNTKLNGTVDGYLKLVKSISDGDKIIKESAQTFEGLGKAQKETIDNTKQMESLNKQMISLDEKLKQAEDGTLRVILEKKLALKAANDAIIESITGAKAAAEAAKALAAEEKKLTTEKKEAEKAAKAQAKEIEKSRIEEEKKQKIDALAETSLVKMRMRLSELTKEYDKAGIRTKEAADEINKLSKEIGEAEEATNRGQRSVGQYGKIWENFKSVLPTLGFAAFGAAAVGVFNSIKNSIAATADAFDFSMSAMNTGLDFFWKTLATGDWSNFTGRMKEAISIGYKYAEMIDKIEDQTRALSMVEADSKEEAINLEIKLRDKTLPLDERKKYGEDRIALENRLVKKRSLIANESFYNEVEMAAMQTKLSESELVRVAKDINSEERLNAEAYNKKVESYEKLRKLNTAQVGGGVAGGSSMIQLPDTPAMVSLKNEINFAKDSTKEYAKVLEAYDNMSDESQKKFVQSYVNMKDAAVSGKENIKKVYSQVSTIGKEITDEEKKRQEDDLKHKKETLDKNIKLKEAENSKMIQLINQNYIDGKTSNERYNAELLLQEQAFLRDKMSLYKEGSKEYEDLKVQVQNLSIKQSEEIKKRDLAIEKDQQNARKNITDDNLITLKKNADASIKINDEKIKKLKDQEEEYVRTQRKLQEKLQDTKIELAKKAISTIFEINNEENNAKLEQLSIEKDSLLSNDKLTKEQRAEIESEYAKKEADIKKKQKAANKIQAAIEVGIETAKSIFEIKAQAAILLSNPLTAALAPMALAQIPLLLAMSAFSLAAIAKYKDGTDNAEERFIAGEAGRELMFLRDGSVGLADKPTYFEGSKFKGAQIFSNPETEKMLGLSVHSVGGRQVSDDRLLNEMKSVRKAIQNKPVAIFNSEYRQIGEQTNNHKEIYLNRLIRK